MEKNGREQKGMKRTKRTSKSLASKVENYLNGPSNQQSKEFDGDTKLMVSTGSTLLDLAISGGRCKYGGIPAGILVEIFGPSGCGKTTLLCEIAGDVQRKGGQVMFHDPEARLNKEFAKIFDLDTTNMEYAVVNTVPEVFSSVREWDVENPKRVNGIFADSLAALSTDMEMSKETGDKMGMRRAKEFSEELRKTCRILVQNNYLMVCSNQVRQNIDAGPYGQRYVSPGGEAIGFYSSLRLRCFSPQKVKVKKVVNGKEYSRVIGVDTQIEVFKSSVWKPYHIAPVTIIFDYGIDDIRQNLQFIKAHQKSTTYILRDEKLGKSLDQAIQTVEKEKLETDLKDEVVRLWQEIESKFQSDRKPKKRS